MKKNLTTVSVASMSWQKLAAELAARKPPVNAAPQIDVWDSKLPGFGLRVAISGRKAWMVMYRCRGKKKRLVLGSYPAMTLAGAWAEAKHALAEAENGRDPAAARAAAEAEEQPEQDAESFEILARLFLKEYVATLRPATQREYATIVDNRLIRAWGPRKANEITRSDVKLLISGIRDQGKDVMANRVASITRKLFDWLVEDEGLLSVNPADKLRRRKERARERLLSNSEIQAIWRAEMPFSAAAFFKLGLLTGQRPGEVLGMRWSDLDLETAWWTIPGDRTKNGRVHYVPLGPQATEILRTLRTASNGGAYVFPGLGGRKPKTNIKEWVTALRAVTADDIRPHDARRTATTLMTSNGVPKDDVSRILNHTLPGETSRVYDRSDYAREKRAGVVRLDSVVRRIVEGRADDKVVALHA